MKGKMYPKERLEPTYFWLCINNAQMLYYYKAGTKVCEVI